MVGYKDILDNPQNYKICCSCDSLWIITTNVCKLCSGYRFEEDVELIKQKTIEISDPNYVSKIPKFWEG